MMIYVWARRWEYFYKFFNELASIDSTFYEVPNPLVTPAMAIVILLAVFGCLKFMWDIMRSKTE